jgi:transposase InsO family protein
MYYQVHVSPQDKDVLRFIWYVDNEIVHYRMKSHVFGGVWCASAATYALRRTLVDGKSCDPLIANTIKRSFYVDDCLKSVETKEEAKKVINQTRQVLKEGGFRLTKFIVNDKSLFYECVPAEDRSDESPNFNFGSNSKALGIRWHVKKDVFFFLLDLHNGGNVTRRKILQVVSSMFDPLGLVNPVLLGGKLVFQMTTRHKLLWDDQLPNEIIMQWYSWVKSLLQLHEVDIPRCVNHLPVGETVFELHHFSDASERAYGSCTYLKCIHKSGETQITLMLSKSKIAPLKVISIPRLELQAAVLSAKVNAMCLKELDFEISASIFWVDSEIVLKYIKSETKRFHVFVANRVSLIRSLSHPDQWNFVPGDQNPADALTRGLEPNQLKQYGWFTGPLFLKTVSKLDVKETDQGNVVDHTDENDPEVKKDIKSSFVTTSSENPLDRLISHFSSWYKLKRAVSWLIRAKDVLLKRKVSADKSITAKEMKIAEDLIVKHVQGQYYSVEIECLQQNNPLRKSSNILSLSPILDESSILRVGGRMKDADIPFDSKHPCILPYNHEISKMIIGDCHEQAHLGVEWTLSIVRQKYWIVKARSMIKVIGKKCVVCQRLFKKPNVQKMSNLPPERIEPFKPPFTYVGLDCFGPFAVKLGRSEVKRYGCVFTCFTTRAVHIEKIDSLEADTFLNAFRRFVARRGSPKKVWSDNGTNFIGSQSEIKKATMQLNDKQIKDFSRKNEIEWHFNPPHASHMGGVWERLIRTIRKVLVVTLRNTTIRDDVLSTLFCEAEAILNSRPLTKVSNDPQDISALTPNHLLLMRSGPAPPPGVFVQNDVYAKRWKYVQFLADQFWKRWVKEYLPELQRRVKWHNIKDNVKKGDLVLLVDEKVPRGLWPLALVLDVNEGRDGLVRSVKVRTKSNVFVRPITKVVKLEMSAD